MTAAKDVDRLGHGGEVRASSLAVLRAALSLACSNGVPVVPQRIKEGLARRNDLWRRGEGDSIAPGVEVRLPERFLRTPIAVFGWRLVVMCDVPDNVRAASHCCNEIGAELVLRKLYAITPVTRPTSPVG